MAMKRAFAILLGLSVVVAGCATTPSPIPSPSASIGLSPAPSGGGIELAVADVPRIVGTASDAASAGAAINAFGLELYRRATEPGVNAVVSPTSIAIALAMARAGARGETASQMDTVLRALGSDDHAAWVSALDQALTGRSGTFPSGVGTPLPVTLRIANAPFAQRDMSLETVFLEALGGRFGAGLRLVDYARDPEAVRALINGWVDEQTERRIPELLGPGLVDELTRLVLVNAVYLKAPWFTPFQEAATGPASFTRLDDSSVEVAMMADESVRPFAAGDGWQAVELRYVGGSLAMTVIVPDDLEAFEASLTPQSIHAIVGALQPALVDLTFPKFGIETKVALADVLAAMGMPDAFDPDLADFSGITTDEQLYITAVVHQANIDVDEKGTEAAAATAVAVGATSALPESVTLRVDRPFLFALRDVPTGAVLFLGRVVDPSISR
jgi:serpin B